MKNRLFGLAILLVVAVSLLSCGSREESTPMFVQISDTQLGFITESEDFSPEVANMERIAAAVNRLRPDFVVFSGDYVQWRTDEAALEGFKQICRLFDEEIPLYFVPGNHDVGNATPEDVEAFIERYGHDRFIFEGEGYTTIGYNSCVIKSAAQGEAAEYEWLKAQLAKASERNMPITLVAHHPLFVYDVQEENKGTNIPLELRSKYLELFDRYDVDLVLSGHLHCGATGEYEGVRLFTTSAAGRPLGEEGSGVSIIRPVDGRMEVTFYEIDQLPQH